MATIVIGRTLSFSTDSVTAVQGAAGNSPWLTSDQTKLIPKIYDAVALSYDANNNITQAVYYQGGLSGTVVATLDMTYTADNFLLTVTRS